MCCQEFVAFEIVTDQAAGAEIADDALAVGGRSGGGGAAFLGMKFLDGAGRGFALPEELASGALEAEGFELAAIECCQENKVAPDAGRGGAGRDGGFPKLVRAGGEFERGLGGLGNAGAVGAAKLGPRGGRAGGGVGPGKGEGEQEGKTVVHGVGDFEWFGRAHRGIPPAFRVFRKPGRKLNIWSVTVSE